MRRFLKNIAFVGVLLAALPALATNLPDPLQETIASPQPFAFGPYRITPLATFSMRARVLGLTKYDDDKMAPLAPFDGVFGWGRMADPEVDQEFVVTQFDRFAKVHHNPGNQTIHGMEIQSHVANMHLIPSSEAIGLELARLKVGQVVKIDGELVQAVDPRIHWEWISSLSRYDTGNGSCEIIFVRSVAMEEKRGRENRDPFVFERGLERMD